ncbi:MAG: acyl-CoA dehydrogenase family protein [Bacillota bacterium]
MSLILSKEHREKAAEFRYFAEKNIDCGDNYPRANLHRAAKKGYMGLPIPRQYGGLGEDFLTYILFIEEVSRVCASTGVIMAVHTSVGSMPLLYFGSEEQKRRYLVKLARGEYIGAFALTEPDAGSDAAAISTGARPVHGGYRLTGRKIFITSGGEADLYTVFATIDTSLGRKGITAFLVEKGSPGLTVGRTESKMGLHRTHTAELLMEDLYVPVSNRLEKEGKGFSVAMSLLDGGRIGIAAQGLGIAAAALDYGIFFLKKRADWKEGNGQGKRFELANLATRLEAARLLTYRAAANRDAGKGKAMEASMAKTAATDLAMEAASWCIETCSFEGIIQGSPPVRFFCDAKATQIYEGTNQIQRIVIARSCSEVRGS